MKSNVPALRLLPGVIRRLTRVLFWFFLAPEKRAADAGGVSYLVCCCHPPHTVQASCFDDVL